MDQYVVNITDEALADMDALYEHIAKKLKAPDVIDPGIVTVTDVLYGASDVHKRLQERHDS